MYNIDLEVHIKIEVTGKLQEALLSLLYTPLEYAAITLNKSLNLFHTKPLDVIEILTTRNSFELRKIERIYRRKYMKDLNCDLKNENPVVLSKILIGLVNSNRPEDHQSVNMEQAYQDAKLLYQVGKMHFDSEENELINILCIRSFEQLRQTFVYFKDISGVDIADFIQAETSGYYGECLLAIVECVRDIHKYFAEQLHRNIQNPSKIMKNFF